MKDTLQIIGAGRGESILNVVYYCYLSAIFMKLCKIPSSGMGFGNLFGRESHGSFIFKNGFPYNWELMSHGITKSSNLTQT